MPRTAHVLSNSKGERRPQHIIFFDTETHIDRRKDSSELHTLKLGHAIYCRLNARSMLETIQTLDFTTYDQFNKFVIKTVNQIDKLYVVSHNIAFDIAATHSLVELPRAGYKLASFYSKATTTMISLRCNKRVIWLLDNSNFFIGKLEILGELVGLLKLKIDFETCSDDDLLIYCQRDVQIMVKLWQLWFDFMSAHDIGNWKMTTSSTAFEAFRHRFIPHTIAIHNDDDVIALERAAYHGGRVEVKYLGYYEGQCYYLDVNSMYPYVMREFEYPYRKYDMQNVAYPSNVAKWLEKYSVIAKVRLKTELNAYPCLLNGKLCYPVGEFITTLCTPELKHLLEYGELLEVYFVQIYGKYPLFVDYVNYFYKLRLKYKQEGNASFEKICKLFGNGLYGKFGQKEIIQEVLAEAPVDMVQTVYGYDDPSHSYYTDTTLGGYTIRTSEGLVAYNAFPAIASHVTAYARMYLFSIIQQIPDKHYYYCDTDSVIVDEVGYKAVEHMLDDQKLGGLKIERSSRWLGIQAAKVYNMEDRSRIKGISTSADMIAPLTWRQRRWPKLGSMLATYGVEDYQTFEQHKSLSLLNSQVDTTSLPFCSPLQVSVRAGANVLTE